MSFLNYTDKLEQNANQTLNEPSHISYVISFIQLAAILSKVDGPINDQEIEFFCSLFPINNNQKNEIKILFLEAVNASTDPIVAALKINYLFPQNKALHEETLSALIKLAICDDYLNIQESFLLKSIGEIFAFDTNQFTALVRNIIFKIKGNTKTLFNFDEKINNNQLNKYFKKLLKQHHPDKFSYLPNIAKEYVDPLNEYFRLINEAYNDYKLKIKC